MCRGATTTRDMVAVAHPGSQPDYVGGPHAQRIPGAGVGMGKRAGRLGERGERPIWIPAAGVLPSSGSVGWAFKRRMCSECAPPRDSISSTETHARYAPHLRLRAPIDADAMLRDTGGAGLQRPARCVLKCARGVWIGMLRADKWSVMIATSAGADEQIISGPLRVPSPTPTIRKHAPKPSSSARWFARLMDFCDLAWRGRRPRIRPGRLSSHPATAAANQTSAQVTSTVTENSLSSGSIGTGEGASTAIISFALRSKCSTGTGS